jgi:hypothetical protein
MKEEELVAFLFGLPNSLKHFEPGDIIARQGAICNNPVSSILLSFNCYLYPL